MTIPSQIRRAGPFVGNSSTTVFPFAFKVFNAADVQVYLSTGTGVDFIETLLTNGVDYSVSSNPDQENNPGGDVVYPLGGGAPLGPNQKLTVIGDLDYEQPTAITNQGGFYPRVIEDALDRCVIQIQQLAEAVARAVKAPVSGGESIDDLLDQLKTQLPMVQAIYVELADVLTVAGNINDINATAASMGAVLTVAGDIGGLWETGVMYDFGRIVDLPVGNTSPPGGNIVTLANHIQEIQDVAVDLTGPGYVATVGASIDNVDAVGDNIQAVVTVADNEADINTVATSLNTSDDINTTAEGMGAILTVAGDIGGLWETGVMYDFGRIIDLPVGNASPPGGNIVTLANHIQEIQDVAADLTGPGHVAAVGASIDNVDAVGVSIDNVNAVAADLLGDDTIGAVAADIDSISAVGLGIDNINAVGEDLAGANTIGSVALNLTDVIAVAGIKQDVQTVAGIEQDVQTVAAIDQDVHVVAAMEQDVQTVAWRQEEVHTLGKDLAGQPLELDYGNITDPVANPASPTGVLGAVWANEQNIAGVAADIGSVVFVAQNLSSVLEALAGALLPGNNLSDLTDPAIARANLGLADLGTLS